MDASDASREFVVELLLRIYPSAQLIEFRQVPSDHYTLRISIPGEIGKSIIVAQTLVDRAPTTPAACRSLEFLFRSELLQQRSRRAQDASRERRAAAEERLASVGADRICAACGQAIQVRDRMVVRQARLFHAVCAAWRPRS